MLLMKLVVFFCRSILSRLLNSLMPKWLQFCYVKKTRSNSLLCRLSSRSCGGLRPLAEAFFVLWAKKKPFTLCVPIVGHFWCSVIFSAIFSSNLRNFKISQKISIYKIYPKAPKYLFFLLFRNSKISQKT